MLDNAFLAVGSGDAFTASTFAVSVSPYSPVVGMANAIITVYSVNSVGIPTMVAMQTNSNITSITSFNGTTSGTNGYVNRNFCYYIPGGSNVDVLVSIVSAELDGADKGNYTLSLTGALTTTASITTTTGIETGTLTGIDLYPNPFSDHINIANVQSVERFVVTNIMGQQVINTKLNGANTINTSHLGSGVFIVTLHLVNGQLAQHRMVKR